MPKKKKTRKQKTLADVRRHTEPKVIHTAEIEPKSQARAETVTPTIATTPKIRQASAPRSIATADYKYLAGDLRKTLFLTSGIIVLELVIKFGTAI